MFGHKLKIGRGVKICLPVAAIIIMSFLLYCGKERQNHRTIAPAAIFPRGNVVSASQDENGVLTAKLDPNSTETQILMASENSDIAGTAIAFPPGSLPLETQVTIQEGAAEDTSEIKSELGLDSGLGVESSGTPVLITSSEPIDCNEPFTIALMIPDSASLNLSGANLKNLAVVYRVKKQGEGKLVVGIKPASELEFADGKVLMKTLYFGWFQVIIFTDEIKEAKEVDSQRPINRGLMLVMSGMPLPSCGGADVGLTIYVQDESTFKYCANGGWQDIDLTGPKGSPGLQGTQGPQGVLGDPGVDGTDGQDGADGQDGNNLYVFDKDSNIIGQVYFVEWPNVAISFDNSGIGMFSLPTGKYTKGLCESGYCTLSSPAIKMNGPYTDSLCYFTSPNCLGNCYLIDKPYKNFIFSKNEAVWLKASGSETDAGSKSMNSAYYYTSGSCVSAPIGEFSHSYPVTGTYSFPTSPGYPFSGPLYIDAQ